MPELVPAPTGGGAAKERPAIVRVREQRERISIIQDELFLADVRKDFAEASRLRDRLIKAREALNNLESIIVGTDEEISQRVNESTPEERFDLLSNLYRFRAGYQNGL